MGYACPVCEDPQADAGHLANHLAFTAMLGDGAHEEWLDEHAPGWGEMGEADLAGQVVDDVEETEFPQVFEDTAGGLEGSEPGEPPDQDPPSERSGALFDEASADDQPHEHARDHEHDRYHEHALDPGPAGSADPIAASDGDLDEETRAILDEAGEMTREMLPEAADRQPESEPDGHRDEDSPEAGDQAGSETGTADGGTDADVDGGTHAGVDGDSDGDTDPDPDG